MTAIPLATFALIFLLTLAVFWALALRPEQRAQAAIRKRLKGSEASEASVKVRLEKEAERLSHVPLLNFLLGRTSRVSAPLTRFVRESGVRMTVGLFLLVSACAGLGTYLLTDYFVPVGALAVLGGVLATFVPYVYVARRRTVRLRAFEEQFPEAIDLIARALRAGHAFTTGLAMVGEEMPEPTRGEFRLLYDQQNFGMPLPDAMRAFAARIPLLDPKFFVTAVLIQRESGGNLSEVLDNLAAVIRDRFKVKRQVQVHTAHARMTGAVLILFPPLLAVAFLIKGAETMRLLWTDPVGVKMVVAAIILQVIGTLMIRKLVDIEY